MLRSKEFYDHQRHSVKIGSAKRGHTKSPRSLFHNLRGPIDREVYARGEGLAVEEIRVLGRLYLNLLSTDRC